MKIASGHRKVRGVATGICAFAILTSAACGSGGDEFGRERLEEVKASMATSGGSADRTKEIPADSGSITGVIVFEGTPGEGAMINMSSDPVCAAAHSGDVAANPIVVNGEGRVKNVVVMISKGLEEYKLSLPDEPPSLEQLGCLYKPTVIVVKPGAVKITSGDKTLHNVHSLSKVNKSFNTAMPSGAAPLVKTFDKEEVIPVKCDVHAWMKAYVVVANTIGAVTDENGAFTLPGIPPGEYTVKTWHETLAPVTQQVTVKPGEASAIELKLAG